MSATDMYTKSSTTKKYDIPLDHLDFTYVEKCSDLKELEKILRVLQSGEEGRYPELERACEDKIAKLNPESRMLRKDRPLASKSHLPKEERTEIDDDLNSWTDSMQYTDASLKEPVKGTPTITEDDLPPVRSGAMIINGVRQQSESSKPNANKRVKPRDYREWDKLDIDKELEKVDNTKEKEKGVNSQYQNRSINDRISAEGLSEEEKLLKANREKDKGNEAYRAGDYDEAITYYSRSLSLLPTAASYNNRALAYLKVSEWTKAIGDCNKVLQLEPSNVKALLRRGSAYKGKKDYGMSKQDLDKVLELEPQNKRAKELIDEIQKAVAKEKKERKEKGRRMVIEEVEGSDDEGEDKKDVANGNSKVEESKVKEAEVKVEDSKPKSRRMVIEEVDDESDEEEESVPETTKSAEDSKSKPRRMVIEEEDSSGDESSGVKTEEVKGEDVESKVDKVVDKVTDTVVRETVDMVSMATEKNSGAGDGVSKGDYSEKVEVTFKGEMDKCEFYKIEEKSDEKGNGNGRDVKKDVNVEEMDNLINDSLEVKSKPSEPSQSDKNVKEEEITSKEETEQTEKCIKSDNKPSANGNEDNQNSVKKESESVEEKEESGSDSDSSSYDTPQDSASEAEVNVEHLKRPVLVQSALPADVSKLKEEGNVFFRSGQYGDACAKYTAALKKLEKECKQEVNQSLMYSNRAACYLKMGELSSAVKDCTTSLQLVPHSVKPLTRRAQAYEQLERYNLAYIDYRHVLLLDNRVDVAHQGTKRCQHMLHQKDGHRWREKLPPLKRVSPWEIPEILNEDGQSLNPTVQPPPLLTKPTEIKPAIQSPESAATMATEKPAPVASQSKKTPSVTAEKKEAEKPVPPEKKFEALKTEGNEFVKQGKFREAITCYTKCSELFPEQVVSYTNRALCHIRLNQAKEAELDCSLALKLDSKNVKALFRRGQARKMLKRYKESLEDLKHLLALDPKNTAAKKEMELVKNYWREELDQMKKQMPSPTDKAAPPKQAEAPKQKRRMVIEEEEEEEEKGGNKQPVQQSKSKPETTSPRHKGAQKSREPVNSGSKSASHKKGKTIKVTSEGLPKVPPSVPKLEKATPYEFIQAWNALKTADNVQPYYDLLKQISPEEIPSVISNKLDDQMLTVITKCVAEHFLTKGEVDTSYKILKNVSTVPRFKTISMFMSSEQKSCVTSCLETLEGRNSSEYTKADIQKLRKDYGVIN